MKISIIRSKILNGREPEPCFILTLNPEVDKDVIMNEMLVDLFIDGGEITIRTENNTYTHLIETNKESKDEKQK